MQRNLNIIQFIFYLFVLLIFSQNIFASSQDASAVKGMKLFDAGNYQEAEQIFRLLLDNEPQNPMLNYYWGASRTENGHFTDKELNSLLLAGKHAVIDRLQYYLGIQYQAQNNWEQALKYYNQFRQSVPETEQINLNLSEKIQQCYNQQNPYSEMADYQAETETEAEAEIETKVEVEETEEKKEYVEAEKKAAEDDYIIYEQEQADNKEDILQEDTLSEVTETAEEFDFSRKALPDLPGVKTTQELPEGEKIDFQINNQITYLFDSQFQTAEGKTLFKEGNTLQTELEEILNETNSLRNSYRNTSNPELRTELGERIIKLENESYNLQDEANQKFYAARNHESQFWGQAGSVAVYNFQTEQQKIRATLNKSNADDAETHFSEEPDSVSYLILEESDFFESQTAARPADQLVYKIQIGAYSRGVPAYRQRLYNKLSLLRKIENYTDEKGVVIYTTGNLGNLEDAEIMLSQVKQEGIDDARVVPYFNGKRITLEQAKKIEAGDEIEKD